MVSWVNRHKRWLQVAVVVLGILMLGLALNSGYARSGWNFDSRAWKSQLNSLAKPAEIGIFLLVGLFAVRQALRRKIMPELGRNLFRLLQVIHVPLGLVVFASALLHGLLILFFRWKSDFHAWTGLVALAAMAIVVITGLLTIPRPARKQVHLTLGLITFTIALVHIFTV